MHYPDYAFLDSDFCKTQLFSDVAITKALPDQTIYWP